MLEILRDLTCDARDDAKEARRYDTFIHYGLVAAMQAVSDAGMDGYSGDLERVGVCIGSGST